MTVIEVRINGKLEVTCGAEDLRQLVAFVAARRSEDRTKLSYVVECMGLRPKSATTDDVLRWLNTQIAVGDEVSFKLVEADTASAPSDTQEISRDGRQDS
jgi:hypothetical protein